MHLIQPSRLMKHTHLRATRINDLSLQNLGADIYIENHRKSPKMPRGQLLLEPPSKQQSPVAATKRTHAETELKLFYSISATHQTKWRIASSLSA